MINEILEIIPLPPPYKLDDKVFKYCMCEEECDCPLESYNDFLQRIKDISGISPDLLGGA